MLLRNPSHTSCLPEERVASLTATNGVKHVRTAVARVLPSPAPFVVSTNLAHMSGLNRKLLPFGSARPSTEEQLSPEMQQYAMKLYREAWDAYKEANCPYGESDEAMLVWYSFRTEKEGSSVAMGRN